MSTTTTAGPAKAIETRVLDEGYGPGAWHGADLKAAIGDVSAELAFWRPGNRTPQHCGDRAASRILHERSPRQSVWWCGESLSCSRVTTGSQFDSARTMKWLDIVATVDSQQRKLATLVKNIAA